MSHITEELNSQPDCWTRAAAEAARQAHALPAPGERVAIVGCGTSYFMAQAAAVLRESAGHGETDAFAASEFPHGRSYDRVLALTRSGTTTEVLDLLGELTGRIRTVAITADPGTPVTGAADDLVVLDFADERSVVQTRFATSALTLLRAHLGLHTDAAAADARTALSTPLPPGLTECTQFTFLGRGWTVVLHGSSGVPDEGLVAAVGGGIAEVNVGTALTMAMTASVRRFLADHPEAVDSRTYLGAGRAAMAREVARIIGVLAGGTTRV
ncbi:MAG: class II fructose-bisphosphate aldolase [Streptomyces sp.]|uniref:class II fructose-bisphosphate aldolase n=1 Tax=Streptomyces sp. TaxID=1931 RepID=UPI0025F99A09|nr:class II fructose-bisphosphate aldolase [Streptomyces sp.]MBW8796876.1 class II fructose-bisphosphate aldolase [Streptomyces sp.]